MNTTIRAVTGLTGFIAGVWALATVPLHDPAITLAAGWTMLLAGLFALVPAMADALGLGDE